MLNQIIWYIYRVKKFVRIVLFVAAVLVVVAQLKVNNTSSTAFYTDQTPNTHHSSTESAIYPPPVNINLAGIENILSSNAPQPTNLPQNKVNPVFRLSEIAELLLAPKFRRCLLFARNTIIEFQTVDITFPFHDFG